MMREWRVELVEREHGELTCALYELNKNELWDLVDHEAFGPFDTGLDVAQWVSRHWGPRAHLRLR